MQSLSKLRWAALVVPIALFSAVETLPADEATGHAPNSAGEADPIRAARLAERDAAWNSAQELLATGNAVGAEERARAVLAIEQEVLGDDDPKLIRTLDLISQCQQAQRAWDAAQRTSEEVVERSIAIYGDDNYRVVDARLAVQHIERMSELTPDEWDQLSQSQTLYSELLQLHSAGQLNEAAQITERVVEIYGRILGERHSLYAQALDYLGLLYQHLHQYAHAEGFYRKALAIRSEILGDRHPDYAQSNNNLGVLYQIQGQYSRAEPYLRQAEETILEVLGERHATYAHSLYNSAILYFSQGDYARAEPMLNKVLEIRKEVLGERHPDYAVTLDSLATVYTHLADYEHAERMCRESLQIWNVIVGEEHPSYATALSNMAALSYARMDHKNATTLYRKVLDIRRSVFGERHPDCAATLLKLAELCVGEGDYSQAEFLFRESLEIHKHTQGAQHPDYALCLDRVAGLYLGQGDYARAEPLFIEALEIRRVALGARHPIFADTLYSLAVLFSFQGKAEQAMPMYREALDIWQEAFGERHPQCHRARISLAAVHCDLGEFGKAESLLLKALDLTKDPIGGRNPDYAMAMHNLAGLYGRQGEHVRAEALYRQALQIWEEALGERYPYYGSLVQMNLGIALVDLQREREGLDCALQAAGIANEVIEESAVTQSERQQLAMQHSYRQQMNSVLAIAKLNGSTAGEVYPVLLASKGKVFLRQRAIRQLRQTAAVDPDSSAAQTFARLTDRTRELDRLAKFIPGPDALVGHNSRLEELALQVEQLQQELAGLSDEFRESQELTALSPDDLAELLPADVALIDLREYHQYLPADEEDLAGRWERQYAAFVTRTDRSVEVVWLGSAEPINAAVLAWREDFGRGLSSDAATRLRRLVWEPLEAHLDGVSIVLISPDGGLNAVPFGALPGTEPETYLIEERAFVTVPAPLLLPEILARNTSAPEDPSLLLVGDVDFGSDPGVMVLASTVRSATAARNADGRWNWDRLPQTRVEVVSIDDTFYRAFGRAPSVSLRDAEATEQAFRTAAADATYIHVATHGYFAPDELSSVLSSSRGDEGTAGLFGQQDVSGWHPGLLSGIVLAGANHSPDPNRDDGVLTAMEVAELNLSEVELATLSACETGLGKTAGGEGLLGLQRAFQLAGARTTVATLWKVEDTAARSLMIEFYENLWRKKLSRIEALRQAQLTMLRGELDRASTDPDVDGDSTRVAPHYWAAFVLSGDWR